MERVVVMVTRITDQPSFALLSRIHPQTRRQGIQFDLNRATENVVGYPFLWK